ncbi:Sec-independent protein translocase protein TatB [Brevundimonas sp. R86498]|uniref:Sec-independent protein translocase protein TatB n=1 Tax=Brevundimonas sp. R86498 TaxID=3093845 RepID=UPI0037C8F7EF
MGGLGPGIGGLEYLVIAAVALIVVGPERLPGMLRQLGKWVAKMRGMANDFRASFDEMARQSELDDLRKEVEALRTGQGAMGQGMVRLGDEANAAFKDIKSELEKTDRVEAPPAAVMLGQPEFPEPSVAPVVETESAPAVTAKARKPRAKASPASATTAPVKTPRPRAPRKPKATS